MIINEGVRVRFGADNSELLGALRGNKAAIAGFATASAAALAGITVASVKMAAQLDRDLRLVSTLGGEAAGNTELLRKEVQSLGREFGRDFRQLAQANYQAVSLGFRSIADSMKVTEAATRLAIAGNGDLVQSTATVGAALNSFGKSADDAGEVAAQLFAIIRDGKFDAAELGQFLSDLPVTAAASGLQLREVGAALATITSKGTPASTAVDQLRSAIIQLEKEGFTGTLMQRVERFAGQSLAQISTQISDLTAARGILALASDIDTFGSNLDSASNTMGDFSAAVDTMNTGAMAEWDKAVQGVKSEMSDFGTNTLPIVTNALMAFNDAMSRLNSFIGTFKAIAMWVPEDGFSLNRGGDLTPLDILAGLPTSTSPYSTPSTGGGSTSGAGGSTSTGRGSSVNGSGGGASAPLGSGDPLYDLLGARTVIGQQDPYWQNRWRMMDDLDYSPLGDGVDIAGELEDFKGAMLATGDAAASAGQDSFDAATAAMAFGGVLSTLTGEFDNTGQRMLATVSAIANAANQLLGGDNKGLGALGILTGVASTLFTGFSSGGYTGGVNPNSVAGVVHGGEYVFNEQAVRSLGLGRLERMHAIAGAGNTSNTVNVTVNASGGDAQAVATLTADAVGAKMRELSHTGRGNMYKTGAQKYGGR